MFNLDDKQIKGRILDRLVRRGKWMASHTSEDELVKGFAKHERGKVKFLVSELKKQGILIPKPTVSGLHYSLNINLKDRIFEYIEYFRRTV